MNLAYALTILGGGGATLVSASKNHDYEFNSSEYYWHTHVIYHYFILPIYYVILDIHYFLPPSKSLLAYY